MFHPSLILIGLGAVFHVDGIAQINLVFQKISNGTVRPVIWMCGVQTGMIHAIPGIGVHGGRQHLFFFQDSGDLAGAVAAGAHGEYPADDGRCFIIYRQLLCFRILDVAIRRSGPQPFSTLRLGFQHRPDFPAGVPNKPLVEQIFERHEIIALCVFRVHIVVDRNVPDAEHGEALFNVETGVKLVSAKAAEILGHDDPNFSVFHICDHLLKCRPLKVTA